MEQEGLPHNVISGQVLAGFLEKVQFAGDLPLFITICNPRTGRGRRGGCEDVTLLESSRRFCVLFRIPCPRAGLGPAPLS